MLINFNWDNVLFSDESRLCLVNDRPVNARRRPDKQSFPQCLNTTMKHGGGGIMVWGCFCKNGMGRLHKVDGIVKINSAALYFSINESLVWQGSGYFSARKCPLQYSKDCQSLDRREYNVPVLAWPGLATVLILAPLKIFGTFSKKN